MSHRKHQKYWSRFLLPDEKVIYMFGVSNRYILVFWIIPATALSALTVYLAIINILLGGLLTLVTLSVIIPAFYLRYFVHYAITDQRVMTREGFLNKTFITADLPSITDVTVHETFFERLLTQTGAIGVNTAGSDLIELNFKHTKRPFQIRHDIYKHQGKWRANNGIIPTS